MENLYRYLLTQVTFAVWISLLSGFSLYSNTKVLFSVSSHKQNSKDLLTSINGIRFLSMTWVVLGHVYGSSNNGFLPANNKFPFMIQVYNYNFA